MSAQCRIALASNVSNRRCSTARSTLRQTVSYIRLPPSGAHYSGAAVMTTTTYNHHDTYIALALSSVVVARSRFVNKVDIF